MSSRGRGESPESSRRWRGCKEHPLGVSYPFCNRSADNLPTRMFGLDITPLKPGLHTFTLTPSPEDLDLDPAAFSDVVVDLRLDHGEDRTFVDYTVRATATLECDRTLVMFQQPVAGRHAVLFVEPSDLESGAEGESDAPGDDVRPLPDPGTPLDLTAPVRDTLLLALPVRRVAPGADEEEIPLVFGALTDEAGEPVDPRWEALRKLRDSS